MKFKNDKFNNTILYILFFLIQSIIIRPEIYPFLKFYNIIRYIQHFLTFFAIIIYVFTLIKNKNINYVLLFFIIFGAMTILNRGNMGNFVYNFESCFTLIVYYYFFYNNNKKLFIKCVSHYWFLILTINFILTIIKPHGLIVSTNNVRNFEKEYFFLGVCNQIIPYYFVGIIFNLLNVIYNNKKKYTIKFLFFAMISCEIIYKSATSFLGVVIFLIGYLFLINNKNKLNFKKNKKSNLTITTGIISIILIYYFIIFKNIQNKFSFIIENILHKNTTLSTRTIIWEEAFRKIKNSFLLGYGAVENNNRYIFIGNYSFNAHNIFLQLLLMGGIALLIIILLMFIDIIKKIKNCQNKKIKMAIFLLLFTFIFCSLTEVYSLNLLFLIIFMGYISEDFPKE